METFEYVLILHLMIRLLGKTNDLSLCLQRKGKNIVRVVRLDPRFANCHDIGDLAIKMVQTEMNKDYKFVYRLVELALILPVATATVEFSHL
jgi:hypothetical protein